MRTARSLPYGGVSVWETLPWTETPLDRDPLDRDPLWTEIPSGQRPPLDRDPSVMWPVVHAGTETPPPVKRITDRCKTLPCCNFIAGGNKVQSRIPAPTNPRFWDPKIEHFWALFNFSVFCWPRCAQHIISLICYYFTISQKLPPPPPDMILDQHLRFLALTKSKDVRVRSTTNSRMWTPLIYGTKILVFDYYIWKNDIYDQKTVEVFVNNTNLTFLSFLYKLVLRCLKKLNCLQWDLNSQNWPSLVYKSDAYPTVLSRHVLKVSDFLTLIKSCSIESRNDSSPKSEVVHETKFSLKISYSTHACLVQLDRHQTCKPVLWVWVLL